MTLGDEAAAANTRFTRSSVVGAQQAAANKSTSQEETADTSESDNSAAE